MSFRIFVNVAESYLTCLPMEKGTFYLSYSNQTLLAIWNICYYICKFLFWFFFRSTSLKKNSSASQDEEWWLYPIMNIWNYYLCGIFLLLCSAGFTQQGMNTSANMNVGLAPFQATKPPTMTESQKASILHANEPPKPFQAPSKPSDTSTHNILDKPAGKFQLYLKYPPYFRPVQVR